MASREKTREDLKNRPWTQEEVEDLERRMERTRALYDMYFQGLERVEPVQARKQLYRMVVNANPSLINNTALRFRLRSLVQRFNVLQSYWNRTQMQIERGTFQRDLKRARRRNRQRGGDEESDRPLTHLEKRRRRLMEKRLGKMGKGEPGKEGGARAPGQAAAAKGAAGPPQPSPEAVAQQRAQREASYQQVYMDLINKRQACNQGVQGMSYDLISQRLEATRSSLIAGGGYKDVDFRVVVEGGKAKLKATPKQ